MTRVRGCEADLQNFDLAVFQKSSRKGTGILGKFGGRPTLSFGIVNVAVRLGLGARRLSGGKCW